MPFYKIIPNFSSLIPHYRSMIMKLPISNRLLACCDYIHKGDRVAQLLIVPVTQAILVQTDTLEESERGEGGFGSTGVRL